MDSTFLLVIDIIYCFHVCQTSHWFSVFCPHAFTADVTVINIVDS
jgi:hypothetical protein